MGASANPHRHPHLARAIAYLRHLGADAIAVEPKKSALKLGWDHEGRRLSISLPRAGCGSSEAQINVALQRVRQRYRAAGVEVRA